MFKCHLRKVEQINLSGTKYTRCFLMLVKNLIFLQIYFHFIRVRSLLVKNTKFCRCINLRFFAFFPRICKKKFIIFEKVSNVEKNVKNFS